MDQQAIGNVATKRHSRSHRNGYTLIAPFDEWNRLVTHLRSSDAERMAFGYCSALGVGDREKLLLRSVSLPDDGEYATQGSAQVILKAANVVRYLLRAKGAAGFVDAHSHPCPGAPGPSSIDDVGAKRQFAALQTPAPGASLLRLISSGDGQWWAAIHNGTDQKPVALRDIKIHGPDGLEVIIPVNALPACKSEFPRAPDARTITCLGQGGLARTRSMAVGVIGIGGVGSMVVRLLAGVVGSLLMVDPDHIEPHNAPRVWFAGELSRGPKVTAAKRALRKAFPNLTVQCSSDFFPSDRVTRLLENADFLFVCPDHNAVRYAAARFAAERITPLIEVGCGGRMVSKSLTALGYHVRLQIPGGPCLACNGLDLSKLEDPTTTVVKGRTGYIDNGEEVRGELACLTTRAAADAVDVFLRYCTGYAGKPPLHLYNDALHFKTFDLTDSYRATPGCPICTLLK